MFMNPGRVKPVVTGRAEARDWRPDNDLDHSVVVVTDVDGPITASLLTWFGHGELVASLTQRGMGQSPPFGQRVGLFF
jgi:hypothetical protein